MIKDKVLESFIKDIATKFNLTTKQVEDIYNSWGLFIRRTTANIDFESIQSEEDFKDLKVNFNIPYIGKLFTSYKVLEYQRNQSKIRRKLNEFEKED